MDIAPLNVLWLAPVILLFVVVAELFALYDDWKNGK